MNCCKVKKGPAAPIQCPFTSCDVEPLLCDAYASGAISRRDSKDVLRVDEDEEVGALDERDNTRSFAWTLLSGIVITMRSMGYPGPTEYMRILTRGVRHMIRSWLAMRRGRCSEVELTVRPLPSSQNPPPQAQVEHPIPVSKPRDVAV